MKKLYDLSQVETRKKQSNKLIYISLVSLFIAIALYVIFLIIVEEKSKSFFTILTVIVWLMWGYMSIYLLTYHIIPNKIINNHINNIVRIKGNDLNGKVLEISDTITLSRSIHIKEVLIEEKKRKRRLYFNVDLNECIFEVDDIVNIEERNNYIYSYKIIEGDKNG